MALKEDVPWVQMGPLGTNYHVVFSILSAAVMLTFVKDHPPGISCDQWKEQCKWVPGSRVCMTCVKWKIACTRTDMPHQLKWKGSLFIESDVEGDWVNHVKQPQLDKGKGWMELMTSELDGQDDNLAQC